MTIDVAISTEILSPGPTQLQRQKFHFKSTLEMLISALAQWALLKESKRDQPEDGQVRAERLTAAATAKKARDDDWCGNFHRKKTVTKTHETSIAEVPLPVDSEDLCFCTRQTGTARK